ncbi:MAG: nucleotidyltransferase family protein [Bacteroidetes bacterium]|nr:nucleotidyltransferase family protein [Bacteroidota bacterium]MCL1968343.1 nucleotidyltransferase family protein [Bacteroidota bacterium]
MIFAAGLGVRLYPLTANKPKALVEYQGKTLLEHVLLKVINAGIQHIVINVHHFGEQIIDFINQRHFNARIEISDEREELLETAGGLKFAEHFFKECDKILLYNVDVISSIDLRKMINVESRKHSIATHLATLAVRHRQTNRYFLFEEPELRLCGWENTKTNEKKICYEAEETTPLAFSGIHIVDKRILDFIPKNEKMSFTPLYLELAKNHIIRGYLHNEDTWKDMGKLDEFKI